MNESTQAPSSLLQLPLPSLQHPATSWGKLHGASTSHAIAEALAVRQTAACILAESANAADTLANELSFFAPNEQIVRFPDYETLPYEPNSPPQDLLAERLNILHQLATGERLIVIVTPDALLTRLPPPEFLLSHTLKLTTGKRLDRSSFLEQLTGHGYLRVERVTTPGEFAVRGAVIDIFAAGSETAIRIDFFDDEIDKLRSFDPSSQLSIGSIEKIDVLPAREFPFDAAAITGFRQRFRNQLDVEPGRASIYRDISEAVLPAGIEYYLPLFFDDTVGLFDYLPKDAILFEHANSRDALVDAWDLIENRFGQLAGDMQRPLLPPSVAFFKPSDAQSWMDKLLRVELSTGAIKDVSSVSANADVTQVLRTASAADPHDPLRWFDESSSDRRLIVTSSTGRRELILELLRSRAISAASVESWQEFISSDTKLGLAIGDLSSGYRLPAHQIQVIDAEEIGAEKPRQRTRRRRSARDPDAIIRELTDLQVGAPVVHEDYGVGRYQGLATLEIDTRPIEFLLLEYADSDKLYVPVHSLHLVSRYTGASPESAPLHRLGSDQWANAKRKAAQQARDVAAELLHIYAERAARGGTAMPAESDGYQRFAMEFPFEETDDQQAAITAVLADLSADKSMDRIICGDVGFGKTEVALRSAFVVAHSGYQVAILVPTTLLAQQHYRTFIDRFADWPVSIKLLSRFNSGKETTEALNGITDGSVDIVIGTHKLLQRDVKFKRLGLVIVDEEHRFGVKHKDQLKRMRADVDILTLTATPIPRTLNMSLGGLRELSIIATAPTDRLAVKTFVGEWRDAQIREAVLREIRRGGQVYFLHNRVEDIERVASKIAELVPEAGVRVAHGQMPESSLEGVMIDFYHRRFNLLVCTTIIESGIDIPTANTIIINRADKLGLAQLHQLRGRVGRSHHQAYAYLIAPPLRALTADARKRLEALEALDTLGSGFTLATHDLEIRGAGELLGEGQSGQITAVGFTLYNELLAKAVTALRAGEEPDLDDPFDHGPEIDLGLIALIPEDYMPDVHMRLVHYKRIANAKSRSALDELQVEMIDRFGLLPDPTKILFEVTWIKLLAHSVGVSKLKASSGGGSIAFGRSASDHAESLILLVASDPENYKLDGPYKLRFTWSDVAEHQRLDSTADLLKRLGATEATEPPSKPHG